ncbi:patellin-3-like [Tripterygium wilfordii]|uniref:Patellin-3-like n=1 Tax=Tripterygium wilfordii TaxID=458696 RepID=A0A7J7DGA8_TRIWF|nr:patellin-3-like [Tripterygium wilfordii]KAF5745086.1 patellin-3-like [Tripterygium wilfordii]
MAEEVSKVAAEGGVSKVVEEEVVVVTDVKQADKIAAENVVEKEPPVPETEEEEVKPKGAVEAEVEKTRCDDAEKVPLSGSFEEESTNVADLLGSEKEILDELKQLVRHALNKHEFTSSIPPPESAPIEEAKTEEPTKPETTKNEAEKEEKTKVAEAETEVIEEKVATTNAVVDDDGAKTVEAIEETIVAVSSSVSQDQPKMSTETEPETKATVAAEEENKTKEDKSEIPLPPEEVSIFGVPLLADERSDVILLKFLRARDFKVKDAFTMLKNTIRWRKEFGIDELLEQNLGVDDLGKVVFMSGFDKEGHPVCYNVYGEFQNKELYQKTFSDEEKRQRFLRWRIQFLERSIRKLNFSPGGISTIVQVNDLKNSPGPAKWELRQATKQALQLLQDNYPEFVAKQVFINVPWWYLAVNKMISPFLTQRTKNKFVVAGPSKSAETLFRYMSAEQLPVKFGGLSKDGEFGTTDAVTEITLKPTAKHTVEFPATETCLLTWEVRVVGWDVSYGAEFVPSSQESYTVIIQKNRKFASTEEPVVCNSFKIGEPGKVVLTINNPTSKKKKLLYRLKTKTCSD